MTNNLDEQVDFLDLLIVLAKNKRSIFKFTAGIAMLSVIVTLFFTNMYTASTTILPPQQNQSSAAAMLGQLGALAGMAGASMGIKTPSDLYIGMLKSRNVEDDLVKRFNLKSLYKTNIEEQARKALEGNTAIASRKDGFITIDFTDKDPKRASEIANAYVDELDRLTSSLAVTEASQRRLFFEKQLNLVKENLSKAEFDLQKLQAKAGLIQVYPLEKEIAESNAKLRAELAAKEIQLSAMRVGVTPNNPDYVRLQGEIASLKKKLDGSDGGNGFDPSMSKESIEYIQKFRNVKYNQAVLEMLYKQYELAKIDEAKDYPVIQVLDKATPPEKKSKPKRALIVILSTFAAFFMSVFYAFVREALNKVDSDPKMSGKLEVLKQLAALKKA